MVVFHKKHAGTEAALAHEFTSVPNFNYKLRSNKLYRHGYKRTNTAKATQYKVIKLLERT